MICTEQDAKTKWCPQARVMQDHGIKLTTNRDHRGRPEGGARCIGRECMFWEWVEGAYIQDARSGALEPVTDRHGTCGLINRSGS